MGQPVVHFEITGNDPPTLRRYYHDLFGWEYDTSGPVSASVSAPGNYGFVAGNTTDDGVGIPGGVVEAALRKAESLGGTRRMGPDRALGSALVVGHFTDPEGHLIGVAGTQ
jgi:predicted enzyme related to lactoylglutathione lyase